MDTNRNAVAPAPQPPRLRLFYGLWPDAETRAALAALQASIGGRPIAPENLHLTLAFLGDQPATVVPMLTVLLAALPATPLPLQLNRGGYFPRQRLAWIGPEPAPAALLELQRQLGQMLMQQLSGFQMTERFLAHITLARKVASAPPALTAPMGAISWRSSQIVLASSTAKKHGSHYQVLAARPLDRAT